MRSIVLIVSVILLSSMAFPQSSDLQQRNLAHGTSLPATCSPGDVFVKTNASSAAAQTYLCDPSVSNQWDQQAGAPTFDQVGTGANTTATMTVGSGGTLDVASGGNVNANNTFVYFANSATATLLNGLVKLAAVVSPAVARGASTQAANTTAAMMLGVCVAGCGTSGTAKIQTSGIVNINFDGATASTDLVGLSVSTTGDATDIGSQVGGAGMGRIIVGEVLTTNASAGTYPVLLNPFPVMNSFVKGIFTIATLPTGCVVSQMAFASDAVSGQNLYICTTGSVWTQVSSPTNGTSGQALISNGSGGLGTALTLSPSATTDTTNATNISSGTLNHSRLPALVSGDIPSNAANTSGNAATATTLGPATFMSGLPLTNTTFPAVRGSTVASGFLDMYTVPTGKRLMVMSCGGINTSGSSVTWYPGIKSTAGGYYLLVAPTAVLAGANTASVSASIMLEAGESISLNSTGAGLNVSCVAVQFDNTAGIKTVKLLGPTSGNNTLYTVPTGKTSKVAASNESVWSASSYIRYSAASVGAGTVLACIVPSGGSLVCASGSTTQIGFFSAPSANVNNYSSAGITLNSGDSIVLNVGTGDAGQLVLISVTEF